MKIYIFNILIIIFSAFVSCKSTERNSKVIEHINITYNQDSLNNKFRGKRMEVLTDFLGSEYNKKYSGPLHRYPGILYGYILEYETNTEYNYRITIFFEESDLNKVKDNITIEYAKKRKINFIHVLKHQFDYHAE